MRQLLRLACLILLPLASAPAQGDAGREMSAGELLAAGEKAFQAGNWDEASERFHKFTADFGGLPETKEAIARVKPLLGICYIRLNRMEEAVPLLEQGLEFPDLDPGLRGDVLFFAGLASLTTGNAEKARTRFGEVFQQANLPNERRMEALVLGGTTYVMEKNWEQVTKFFAEHGETISKHDPAAASKLRVIVLHALMEEGSWAEAGDMAERIRADMDEVRQVVLFSSLLISLGDHFLEEGESHQAIRMLRMVPTKREILELQKQRLDATKRDLERAIAVNHPTRVSQLQSSVSEIEDSLAGFEKETRFDSAARLRLASAYFQMERVREACLILDQMVRQMEPDAVVESAAASLMRGWMTLERHQRSVRTADMYVERCKNLAEQPNLPEVLFLRAQALEGLFKHREAADGYSEVANRFSNQDIAPRARFMAAYNVLQLEEYQEAGKMFDAQLRDLRESDEMWPHVVFWRAMTYYFAQEWDSARGLFEEYLGAVESNDINPEYVDDARFRIAFTHFSEAEYPTAISLFEEFEREFPTSEWLPEALLALGDARAGEGDLDVAELVYARIPGEAPGFHDEGWMKRGNIRKVRKDFDGMRAHFTEFLEERPQSPRIAEALQWLGWVEKQEGNLEAAREVYWDAIEKFGNDPARPGLEEIVLKLQSFYPADQKLELVTRYRDLFTIASGTGKRRLAVRLGWALAHHELNVKTVPPRSLEMRKRQYQMELARIRPLIDAKETAPRILADVADSLMESGSAEAAVEMYEELRKWWPRAPERDRAFAGLGFHAAETGREPEALEWFEKFEKTSVMPRTAPDENGVALVQGELGGKVAMAKSRLLATRDPDKALGILLAVQKSKSMPTRVRAEAFMEAGKLHVSRSNYRESLPYFEQIYILFNRFPDLVAEAYVERGQALEKLGMNEKAREVYSECVNRSDLKDQPEYAVAAERARALGGVLPAPVSEGSIIPPDSDSP